MITIPYCRDVTRVSTRILSIASAAILTACGTVTEAAPTTSEVLPPSVVDNFDGPAGARPDPHFWGYDLDNPSPENHELQRYTASTANVRLDGKGHLVLEALKTPTGYTSGRVVTRGKLPILYGTVTARIKFPTGQGIWPAFWLLGTDIDTVGWPRSGEIDVMELVNTGTEYHVTLHGPQGDSDYLQDGIGPSGPTADLSSDFHDYWVTRRPNRVTVGLDKTTLADFTPASLPPGATWVFNKPMYALLNVAVGGDWPGPPDASTRFPATMLVDWFRYTP